MQLSEFDAALTVKDEKVATLKEHHACLDPHTHSHFHAPLTVTDLSGEDDMVPPVRHTRPRRGKAPPVDAFSGENPEVHVDDWLPPLQRAADWNSWDKDKLLIQLAGRLSGRALQERNLLGATDMTLLLRLCIASLTLGVGKWLHRIPSTLCRGRVRV